MRSLKIGVEMGTLERLVYISYPLKQNLTTLAGGSVSSVKLSSSPQHVWSTRYSSVPIVICSE